MKFREFIAIIERHGFVLDRQRGSHRIYKGEIGGQCDWSLSQRTARAATFDRAYWRR